MHKDELSNRYLETAPIGQFGGISEIKIEWIKYNFLKFFPGKEKTYLDIGPGQGETLILWKQLGYQNIKSVDISEDVCNHIEKLGLKCEYVDNTQNFLKENIESFDFIMLNDVVEHISKEDLVDFMIALHGSLKKEGIVLIKVPNAQSPHFSLGRYGDLTHVQSFTESSLVQLLRIANFDSFDFFAEKTPLHNKSNIKQILAIYFITPLYFWFIRNLRTAISHNSPEILTQSIIAVAKKK